MASKVTTLFEDSAKQNALYPRTKVSAVSDGSGNGLDALLNGKQATLVSGTNIKTVDGNSLLGSGNIVTFVCADTSNVLYTHSGNYSSLTTLNALAQDGIVFAKFKTGDGSKSNFDFQIDGVQVFGTERSMDMFTFICPLKAGQIIKVKFDGGHSNLNIYGLNT